MALQYGLGSLMIFLYFDMVPEHGRTDGRIDNSSTAIRDPIMGSLKSPCATSYRSSIATIALNCLVFEKVAFFAFWRQTDKLTDGQTDGLAPMH